MLRWWEYLLPAGALLPIGSRTWCQTLVMVSLWCCPLWLQGYLLHPEFCLGARHCSSGAEIHYHRWIRVLVSTAMRISGSMAPSMCSNSAFFHLTLLQFAIITSSSSLCVMWCFTTTWVAANWWWCRFNSPRGVGYRGWCCWGQLAVGCEGRGHADFFSSSVGSMACGARCIVSRV